VVVAVDVVVDLDVVVVAALYPANIN